MIAAPQQEATHQELTWEYPIVNPRWAQTIIKEFHIHPATAQIFVSRQFETLDQIHKFLYAKLTDLCDPFLFNEMHTAVSRLIACIKTGDTIIVFGDNDVDGMTGAALLTEFLQYVGAKALAYIPARGDIGDSPILEAVLEAERQGAKILITVDCGISANDEIAVATTKNIDVIVTDHHEPPDELPKACALLNPKLKGSTYPNRHITGVGVAFKLAHALARTMASSQLLSGKKVDLKHYLDLVALGTIADMGNLDGENRIMVRYGLRRLRRTRRPGLLELYDVCDLTAQGIDAQAVSTRIAPRLNSLGRVDNPQKGVELLLINGAEKAATLAEELEIHNTRRQQIERKVFEDAFKQIRDNPKILQAKAIVLWSNKWHAGVIPIVAARLTKMYNRPTTLIAVEKGIGKGSMRTIPEFTLLPVLKGMEELFDNYGGHDYACGFTIKEDYVETFCKRFLAVANDVLQDHQIAPRIKLDTKVQFSDLTFEFMDCLALFGPHGNGNSQPVLYCDAEQAWAPKVIGASHLKLYLQQDDRMLEGIAFGMAHRQHELKHKGLRLRVAFTPQINTFLDKPSIQLNVKDFRILHGKE